MDTLEKFLELRAFVNGIERRGLVYGASFSEFVIMRAINQEGSAGIRRVDLADAVALSVSGVTRALAPLEKLGYVERLDEALDARVRRVGLSPSGAALYQDISENVQERMNQVSSEMQELLLSLTK